MDSYIQNVDEQARKFQISNPEGETKAEADMDPNERQMAQSRKAYYKELKKVLEESDVICEVLDARDPQGCRNHEIEQEALKQGKKVVLILNKIDLVPT